MHYRHGPFGFPVLTEVEDFLSLWPAEQVTRLERAELEITGSTTGVWVPKFAHREIGIFEVFHDVGWEYVAGSCFIYHGQSLFVS